MESETSLKEKLHSETAKMSWLELQPFFAKGSVLHIEQDLDLIEIAVKFAQDQADQLKPLFDSARIGPPSNDLARQWYDQQASLWSVVVAPFVLVQQANEDKNKE